ncbi:MAG: ECF transporter S component [Clostridiales bacterium]|nr:ECF transporter S component [Clostridiales bacterium]
MAKHPENVRARTAWLARLAILLAVVIVMTALNIGNIPIGPIVATVYQVPVVIGAALLGVGAGCILGGAWGVFCFWLALSGQTTDIVALATVQQSPLLYFCIAFFPRLLCGLLSGLVCRGMKRICRGKGTLAYAVTGAVGSLCNTVLYLGALYLLIRDLLASLYHIDVGAVGAMVLSVATTNGLLEAVLSCVLTAAICRALGALGSKKGEAS